MAIVGCLTEATAFLTCGFYSDYDYSSELSTLVTGFLATIFFGFYYYYYDSSDDSYATFLFETKGFWTGDFALTTGDFTFWRGDFAFTKALEGATSSEDSYDDY